MYCCLSLHQQALKLNLLKELCPCLQQTLEHCKEIIKWKISSPKTMTPMSDLEVRLINKKCLSSVQFSSVTQSRPTLCDPMNRSTPGFPVHHQFPESTQTHVHWVSDAIQPYHPLSSPSPLAPNPSQHQGLFQWASSSHQVAKVLEFQLQHQSFQWVCRVDFL